ncbi:hypothetical protein G4B88_020110 [Cannabis sativa]|uniref:Ycf2 N-terminal domain-containing protein n=1 Tax=Cannabis sativa TaxID=3483 RepID=A0A7J6GLW6_CANSA|nr:hypothetical protein G4B88_020110 [Cannabis sativa]
MKFRCLWAISNETVAGIEISFKEKDTKYLEFLFEYYMDDLIREDYDWELFDRLSLRKRRNIINLIAWAVVPFDYGMVLSPGTFISVPEPKAHTSFVHRTRLAHCKGSLFLKIDKRGIGGACVISTEVPKANGAPRLGHLVECLASCAGSDTQRVSF